MRYGAPVGNLIGAGYFKPPGGVMHRLGLRAKVVYHRFRMENASTAAYVNARMRDPQNEYETLKAAIRATEQAKESVSEYGKMMAVRKELSRKGSGGGEVQVRSYTRSRPNR